jgi:hypothetical protein
MVFNRRLGTEQPRQRSGLVSDMTNSRLHCCVPFCARTTVPKNGWDEWLCQKHWPGADHKLRALKLRAEKFNRQWLYQRAWARCKRQAIERALT